MNVLVEIKKCALPDCSGTVVEEFILCDGDWNGIIGPGGRISTYATSNGHKCSKCEVAYSMPRTAPSEKIERALKTKKVQLTKEYVVDDPDWGKLAQETEKAQDKINALENPKSANALLKAVANRKVEQRDKVTFPVGTILFCHKGMYHSFSTEIDGEDIQSLRLPKYKEIPLTTIVFTRKNKELIYKESY